MQQQQQQQQSDWFDSADYNDPTVSASSVLLAHRKRKTIYFPPELSDLFGVSGAAGWKPHCKRPFVRLHKLFHCTVYLLFPVDHVTLSDCRDVTLIAPFVGSTFHIYHCQEIVASIQVPIISIMLSQNVTIYRGVGVKGLEGHVLISAGGQNERIVLAPFNIGDLGMLPWPNQVYLGAWNSYSILWRNKLQDGDDHLDGNNSSIQIMPPHLFHLFQLPFRSKNPDLIHSLPPSRFLPKEYSNSCESFDSKVNWIKNQVQQSFKSDSERTEFQLSVEESFRQWMKDNGVWHDVTSLIDMFKAIESRQQQQQKQ